MELINFRQDYQGKQRKSYIPNINNEKRDIPTDPINIKKKIKGYHEQLCANAFHNLKETRQIP